MIVSRPLPLKKLPKNVVAVKSHEQIRAGEYWLFYGDDDFYIRNHNSKIRIVAIVEGQIVYKAWNTRLSEYQYHICSLKQVERQIIEGSLYTYSGKNRMSLKEVVVKHATEHKTD